MKHTYYKKSILINLVILLFSSLCFSSEGTSEAEAFSKGELEPFRAIDSGVLPNSLNEKQVTYNTVTPEITESIFQHKQIGAVLLQKSSALKSQQIQSDGQNSSYLLASSVLAKTSSSCQSSCSTATSARALLDEMLSTYETTPFYYGLAKNESMVFKDKAGNPFELAAFYARTIQNNKLVADWHYVLGRVRVTPEQMASYIGIEDPKEAATALSAAGYGVYGAQDVNGVLLYFEFNHVWLEVKEKADSQWVAIDPSFKSHSIPYKRNLNDEVGKNVQSLIETLSNQDSFDDNGLMQPNIEPVESFTSRNQYLVNRYLKNNPTTSYDDIVETRTPRNDLYNGFGYELPYLIIGSTTKSQSFGSNQYQNIRITIGGIDKTLKISDISGHRLTISYEGATDSARSIINANGGVLGLGYKSINLIPVLKSNGVTIAKGKAAALGAYQRLRVIFSIGSKLDGTVIHNVTVGGIHAIALGFNRIASDLFNEQVDELVDASTTFRNDALNEQYAGQLMHVLGLIYSKQLQNTIKNTSAGSGAFVFHKINEALMSIDLTAKKDSSGTYRMAIGSRGIDAPRSVFSVLSSYADTNLNKPAVLFSIGLAASGLEHEVFERAFGWPANSAVSILNYAASNELPIYVIRKSNLEAALAVIDLPDDVETSMRNAVNSGRIVITPKEQLKIGEWNGIGYIILDERTGAAGYMINAGNAGGRQAFSPMNRRETNETFHLDVAKIVEAAINGALKGEWDKTEYSNPLYSGISDTSAFLTDLIIIGDIRNISISLYNVTTGQGELSDVFVAAVGLLPVGDMAKVGYRFSNTWIEHVGKTSLKNALDEVSDNSTAVIVNLYKNSDDLFDFTPLKIKGKGGNWDSIEVKGTRNGMSFTNVQVANGRSYIRTTGHNPDGLTSTSKGTIGEQIARDYAISKNLKCIYCTGKTNANGVDNIYKDSAGNYVIEEVKFTSGRSQAGLGMLGKSQGSRQLTKKYLFGGNASGNSALSRTPDLSFELKTEILQAAESGKLKTRYTVVKDKQTGSAVTKQLTQDSELGVDGSSAIDEIVIIELSAKE